MTGELDAAIAADIEGWDAIEDHRTGTAGDLRTAQWLADLARDAGATPVIDRFPLRRWVLRRCRVEADGTTAEGVPLFDGGTTGANGVEARLAALPSDVPGIGLGAFGNDAGAASNQALAKARDACTRPALVAVSKMNSAVPGLALQNADRFAQPPRTPATLQVATEHEAWLGEAAAAGALAKVTAHVDFEDAQGSNVRVRVAGRDAALRPLVVITPKSSWWVSTAERGGGIAVWLALLRRFARRSRRGTCCSSPPAATNSAISVSIAAWTPIRGWAGLPRHGSISARTSPPAAGACGFKHRRRRCASWPSGP